ncbi:MAG: leucine-rich repeat domain-containing protein [Lewinellaceae bacterium]|nr:leucine-rich repeat domain-containing protein [Lewinellaceae bacterium]
MTFPTTNSASCLPRSVKLANLTELYLRDNQISNLPPQIGRLSNLTSLDLFDNQISNLPPQIGRLSNLTSLDLFDNQLSDLPAQISQLANLTELNLSFNQLSELPAQIGQLANLTELNLSFNQLSELPAQIGQLTNLTELNLSSNRLSELPAQVSQLTNLTELYLSSNRLSELPPQIGQLASLTELSLYNNQLTQLPSEIKLLKSLARIDLTGNPFSEAYVEQLRADMPWCTIKWAPPGARELFAAKKYPEAFAAQQKAVAADSTNYNLHYYLSLYALFAQQPQAAIEAAKKTLELNPGAQSVETNLALGYLLDGQWEEAEKVYRKWKGKSFPNDHRITNAVFLKDIADLEAAGIIHPDFEKVRRLLGEEE